MAKKETTVEDIYPLIDKLNTSQQLQLQGYLERTLEQKAKTAEDELQLIKGQKQN